ncbi:hypothetical protein PISMIDRAFT_678037 [Pisolithus microcarpus 441]|uniref:Uncharacterized protein n=1 Tax=Pisolithus microcarpus 441 TaxID=765257 RepID=A0A0C9ZY62_9AGAM|nr:hypothetical protein PISMIDRAFT_678037 [Pisolithus microcarpus 441]
MGPSSRCAYGFLPVFGVEYVLDEILEDLPSHLVESWFLLHEKGLQNRRQIFHPRRLIPCGNVPGLTCSPRSSWEPKMECGSGSRKVSLTMYRRMLRP